MLIELCRHSYSPAGTFGTLTVGDLELATCELPWHGNKPGESCIPEGVYDLQMRESPVVQRSSGGEFARGWEVCDVPGRTFIMLHPANWPGELQGCISVGLAFGVIAGQIGVSSSREAFRKLMAAIPEGENELRVYQYRPQYP